MFVHKKLKNVCCYCQIENFEIDCLDDDLLVKCTFNANKYFGDTNAKTNPIFKKRKKYIIGLWPMAS